MVGESGVRGSSEADDGGELEGVQGVGIGKVMAIWNTKIFSFFCLRLIDKRIPKERARGYKRTEKRQEKPRAEPRDERVRKRSLVGGVGTEWGTRLLSGGPLDWSRVGGGYRSGGGGCRIKSRELGSSVLMTGPLIFLLFLREESGRIVRGCSRVARSKRK